MTSETRKYLGRDAILGAADLKSEDIFVAEWDGWVRVRGLTGTERDAYENSIFLGKGRANYDNIRARLVALTVVDPETGERLFKDEKDVSALGGKSSAALDQLFAAAQRLSGLGAKDVEELAKN
jgi:hypothetical protein